MTFTDYLTDLTLIGLVVLQVRGRRLSLHSLLLPIGIVALVAHSYLHNIPTAGNDLLLIAIATTAGLALGIGAGLFTKVTRRADGHLFAKAGLTAAILWILGVGTRFAFQLYSTHGGGPAITRFSTAHHITTSNAWVAALVLMALAEVLARTAIMAYRALQARPTTPAINPTTTANRALQSV